MRRERRHAIAIAPIRAIHDVQLERAEDYLKGVILYRDRASHRKPAHQQLASQKQ